MGFSAAATAVAAVVSAAAATYSSVKQGEAQSAALKAQQQQQQQREQQLRTRALQDEAARREELVSNLSTVSAIRAGRGLSQISPTALVIRDDITDDAMDSMLTSRLNILNGAESERLGAIQSGNAASTALTTGYLKGGISLLDYGAKQFAGSGSGLANSDPNFQGTYGGKRVSYLPNTGSKY
ncbi:hypothetical protein ACIU1J_05460 [Azospirillum doebereinerae]|uniref:hypothetical protein n=1 Tax=Azospirillum doebereinerae TaxID=92933 RepID=UPI001EE5EDD4|nr:hypothetical protein [Azospirillum doebereinerae]MCG5240863.1 hypothetical protein [Azospirillum doebereinerae]